MSEINVISYLNSKLATKQSLSKQREREEKVTRQCEIHLLDYYDVVGARPAREIECKSRTETRRWVETYEEQAFAISSQIVHVENFRFHTESVTSLPEKAILTQKEYQNTDKNTSLTVSINWSISATIGYSVSKSEGVSTTDGFSIQASVNYQEQSRSVGYNFSRTLSASTTVTEDQSETITRSESATVTIAPGGHGRIDLLNYLVAVEIPFSATLVVDGSIGPNASTVTRASQLLTKEERTLPFKGVLKITNVSKGKIAVIGYAGEANGDGGPDPVRITERQFEALASSLSAHYLGQFKDLSECFVGGTSEIKLDASPVLMFGALDVIGPPDGIHYEIISVTNVTRMTAACGFNDLGLPNAATYRVEKRHYKHYQKGKLLRQWFDNFETFLSCMRV